jgi:hypothetical protein
MMIRIATLVFMAVLATGHAFAEEAAPATAFNADAYPPEVRKSLEYANAECAGTGGGTMDILVTLPNGRIRTVFSDRVRTSEIPEGRGPRTIRFALHGSYCGGHGNPSCYKEHRITTKPFKFVEPK